MPGRFVSYDRCTDAHLDPSPMTSDAAPIRTLGGGIVGCGNIAGPYARSLAEEAELELVAATDVDASRAEAFALEHDCRAHASLEALLADPAVELVINLTVHHAHYAVTKR